MLLPLALIVVPTLLVRSLLPAGVSTMWPAVAGLMAIAGFVILSVVVHDWTRSFGRAALATITSFGLTLLGLIWLLFWASREQRSTEPRVIRRVKALEARC